MAFRTEIKIRFRDLDAMGHLNNAIPFTFMEQARTEYYMALTGARDFRSLDFIVARAEFDYESPAFLDETLEVLLWPAKVGNTSFTLDYELKEKTKGRVVGRGRTVLVRYDYARREKLPIEGKLREALEVEVARGK